MSEPSLFFLFFPHHRLPLPPPPHSLISLHSFRKVWRALGRRPHSLASPPLPPPRGRPAAPSRPSAMDEASWLDDFLASPGAWGWAWDGCRHRTRPDPKSFSRAVALFFFFPSGRGTSRSHAGPAPARARAPPRCPRPGPCWAYPAQENDGPHTPLQTRHSPGGGAVQGGRGRDHRLALPCSAARPALPPAP